MDRDGRARCFLDRQGSDCHAMPESLAWQEQNYHAYLGGRCWYQQFSINYRYILGYKLLIW